YARAIFTFDFLKPGRLSRSACCSGVSCGPPRPGPAGPPRPGPAAGVSKPLGPEIFPTADVMLAPVRPHATPGCAAPGAPGPPRPAPPPGAPPTPGTGFPDMKIAPFTWTPFFQRSGCPM